MPWPVYIPTPDELVEINAKRKRQHLKPWGQPTMARGIKRVRCQEGCMDNVKANSLACVTAQTTQAIARRRQQGEFLRAYRETVGSSDSSICKMLHINAKLLSRWKNEDPLFKLKYLEAAEQVRLKKIELLEQELYRRAVEGVDTPLVSMGRVVTTIKKYSDTLLTAALKAELPKKYEKQDKGMTLEFGEDGGKYIKAYVGFNPDEV